MPVLRYERTISPWQSRQRSPTSDATAVAGSDREHAARARAVTIDAVCLIGRAQLTSAAVRIPRSMNDHAYVVFGAGRQGTAAVHDLATNCDARGVLVVEPD